jgi:chaperonin GroEL
LTGAELVDSDLGMNVEECEPSIMGSAKKVIVTKDDTVIINGDGDKTKV